MTRQRSLTLRLTVLFALMSVLVLAGFSAFIVSAIARHFNEQDDQLLQNELQLVRTIVQGKGVRAIPDTFGEALRNHPGFYLDIRDADGGVFYSTLGHSADSLLAAAASHAPDAPFSASLDGRHGFRVVKSGIGAPPDSPLLQVLVAVDTDVHEHFFHDFGRTLALYAAAAALLAIALGWWVARQGLSPLRSMAAKVQAVTSRNFDERMPADAMPAEMADLARPLNAMLERLQRDFTRLTEFSSDLAHELRTPISNLLTQSHVILTQDRTAQAYREVIVSYAEELQRLARTISDMLFLAQTENGITLPTAEQIDIEAEARDLFDFYDALAEEKRVELKWAGAGRIRGDRLMLRRALSNLISNALRYTPPGGAITVRARPAPGSVRLSVENEGKDIPPDMLPHLFDRFYRADKSRAHRENGSAGLGLSITRAIVQAHGGTVSVTSRGGKTSFDLVFPA